MNKQKSKFLYLLWAILAIGIYYVISNILQLLAYKIIPEFIHFSPSNQKAIMLYLDAVDIVISMILLIIVFLVYKKIRKGVHRTVISVNRVSALKCIITGIALAGFSFFVSFVCSFDMETAKGTVGTEKIVMLLLTSVFFAPLIEEFLFRGIVYNLLSKFKEGWIAILLSSIIFAAYHADLIQGIFTFVIGMVLAFTYYKTRNIKYPIFIHAANNAFVAIAGFVLPEAIRPFANWFSVVMIIPMVIWGLKNK